MDGGSPSRLNPQALAESRTRHSWRDCVRSTAMICTSCWTCIPNCGSWFSPGEKKTTCNGIHASVQYTLPSLKIKPPLFGIQGEASPAGHGILPHFAPHSLWAAVRRHATQGNRPSPQLNQSVPIPRHKQGTGPHSLWLTPIKTAWFFT